MLLTEPRNVAFSAAVPERALKVANLLFSSFDYDGVSDHRAASSRRTAVSSPLADSRTTATRVVGLMFHAGPGRLYPASSTSKVLTGSLWARGNDVFGQDNRIDIYPGGDFGLGHLHGEAETIK